MIDFIKSKNSKWCEPNVRTSTPHFHVISLMSFPIALTALPMRAPSCMHIHTYTHVRHVNIVTFPTLPPSSLSCLTLPSFRLLDSLSSRGVTQYHVEKNPFLTANVSDRLNVRKSVESPQFRRLSDRNHSDLSAMKSTCLHIAYLMR